MVEFTHPNQKVSTMTEKRYRKICKCLKRHKFIFVMLKFSYKILPYIVAISYFLLLIILLIYNDIFSIVFLKVLFVPLFTFLFVTFIRKYFNFKRPYEVLNIEPLMKKTTKGLSFPSRHTASVFIIAMTFLYVNKLLGILFLIFSVMIGLSRFLAGVHFFRDVLAGALISIFIGTIFLFVI